MNNNNSLMLFDQLATELIFEIFDYLSCNDIIYAFFHFNERFNSILLQYQRYINNLETPTTNFYFWQTIYPILGSEIQCLTINTLDFEFKLDLFPNLKFLIISSSSSFNIDQLYSLLYSKEFNKLISLKILIEIIRPTIETRELEKLLFNTIFHHENSLQTFEYCSILYLSFFKHMNNLSINENLRSLSLKTFDYTDAFALLEYTPNLKSFKLIITSFQRRYRLHTDLDFSQVKLENIDLTYEKIDQNYGIDQIDFRVFTSFLKQFSSSLIYLSINLNNLRIENFQIDGITLQQQLLESMTHLKTFHLYVEQYSDSTNILSTFENQFWFDHQWSVGMHETYLYTLPFHFNHIKSVNSIIFNAPQMWPNVTSIELSECVNLDLNFIKQLRIKMPNLRTIIFNSIEYSVNETDTRLDSVTTIYFQAQVTECIQQCLINSLPNVKELILNKLYRNESIPMINERIERLTVINQRCSINEDIQINDVYFPNVKHLEIQGTNSEISIMKIFKNFKNLTTLTLYVSSDQYCYLYLELPNLTDTLSQINLIEILKQYQIKQNYKYVQFIKKQTNN